MNVQTEHGSKGPTAWRIDAFDQSDQSGSRAVFSLSLPKAVAKGPSASLFLRPSSTNGAVDDSRALVQAEFKAVQRNGQHKNGATRCASPTKRVSPVNEFALVLAIVADHRLESLSLRSLGLQVSVAV